MLLPPLTQQEQMVEEFEASDLLAIRRLLRRTVREAQALLAVLALNQIVVEFAGDDSVMPRIFPRLNRSVPCFDSCRCRDGDIHDIAFVKVRTFRTLPSYGLYLVEPGPMDTGRMFELLQGAMDELEGSVIHPAG